MSDLERRIYTVAAGLFGLISAFMAIGLFLGEGDPDHSRLAQAVQGVLLSVAAIAGFVIARRLASGSREGD